MMDINLNILKKSVYQSQDLCPQHGYPLLKIGNHELCKVCAQERIEQSKKEHETELKNRLLENRIRSVGLYQRYLDCGFSNYIAKCEDQETTVVLCKSFAQRLLNGNIPNLILYGNQGTGKTHLSSAIIRNILHSSQMSVRYITSAQISQIIMNSWNISDQSEEQWINYFADFDLLVVDEYGLHDRHISKLELIHKVLYRRYDVMKPTLLISNFSLELLEQDLGARLWSRLHEHGLMLSPCYWQDYRLSIV